MQRLRNPLIGAMLALASATAGAEAEGEAEAQREARDAVAQGRFVPLETLVADALRRHPGRVVEVELDDDEYEIEILRDDGRVVELDYAADTGELREEEFDED